MTKKGFAITVIIEIPQGSRNKYEYDPKTGYIRFDRMLFSSVHYPCDYGFVPDTLADDGDPLDALVILNEPTFPGCAIESKPVGLFKMEDEEGHDEKILCVPVHDPLWNHIHRLKDVPPHLLKEIEHFFTIYKDLERPKYSKIHGWFGYERALQSIADSKKKFVKKKK